MDAAHFHKQHRPQPPSTRQFMQQIRWQMADVRCMLALRPNKRPSCSCRFGCMAACISPADADFLNDSSLIIISLCFI